MILQVLLWVATGIAVACSVVAIVWSIYVAYTKNNKFELQHKHLNNNSFSCRPTTDPETTVSEISAMLPESDATKMDYNSRMEQYIHMQTLYSIDSCSDASSTSDEEELTSLTVLTREATVKSSRKSPSPEPEPEPP